MPTKTRCVAPTCSLRPVVINGELWDVVAVRPDSPLLIDRTGTPRLATTDGSTMTIRVASTLRPPLLDKVILHEVAHAITISWGLLDAMRLATPRGSWVAVEEWAAQLVENHSIEAVDVAGAILGRPVCVRERCR